MNVLVLLGSNSPEREVSLRSGSAVIDALKKKGYNTLVFDPAEGYEGLDSFIGKVDVVLPIIHGLGGEDGELQLQLEKRNFKFLGADSIASKLAFDKVKFKELLNKLSILTPASSVVDKESYKTSALITKPYVLKPIDGGSTIDTFIVRDPTHNLDLSIFDLHKQMLLEELIEGDEITVPVLGNKALPVIEIIPPEGKDFDYENKYNGATQELCPPVNVSEKLQLEAQSLAEKVHLAAGIRHLSRTDIIIDNQDQQWILEINTIPGLTNQSLFPKAAAVAGIDFEDLVEKFVQMAASS